AGTGRDLREEIMPFIAVDDHSKAWMIGPADGARKLLFARRVYQPGFLVGLHTHDGDEAQLILRGEVRFHAGGEQRVCRAGDAVFAPPGMEHGFLTVSE